MAHRRDPSVQSVERAVAILRSFSRERPERGVSELARELGIHKSTVYRLLATLERHGLVARNPETERYRLGLDLIVLAAQVVEHMDVREIARPHLRELSERCQETVNLAILHEGQVMDLEQFAPPVRSVKNIGWVGRRMPPHCTAAGKVLLAHLPPDKLERFLHLRLERLTPRTITDPNRLREELERVRVQGYATAEEELEDGLNALAAPIYDHTGAVRAAASLAGPAFRIPPAVFPHLATLLVETCGKISAELGYRPGAGSP
ncbi:MAG: IclR family transcriptional regulator [Anaerolineae bacterium]|nr:IclR family transcriptional regulator [Anaerolineae bacterium]